MFLRKPAMAALGLASLAVERLVPEPEGLAHARLRDIAIEETGHVIADIEWRYRQTRELLEEARVLVGGASVSSNDNVVPFTGRQVTAEDINDLRHRLTGYNVYPSQNAAGVTTPNSIRWTNLRIVYAGVDYKITDGATLLKWTWFTKPGSYTPETNHPLNSSNTKPTLGSEDILVFINNAGIPTVAATDGSASLPSAVGDSAVDFNSLAIGAVSGDRIGDAGIGVNKLGTGAVNLSGMVGQGVLAGDRLANGAIGATQLGVAAVTTPKLNILSHIIY